MCMWCVCIYTSVHIYAGLCCVGEYAYVCIHMEAHGWHKMSTPIALHFIHWGKVSQLDWELTDTTSLASQLGPWSLCLLPSLSGFHVGSGVPTLVFIFVDKCFHHWAISSALNMLKCYYQVCFLMNWILI